MNRSAESSDGHRAHALTMLTMLTLLAACSGDGMAADTGGATSTGTTTTATTGEAPTTAEPTTTDEPTTSTTSTTTTTTSPVTSDATGTTMAVSDTAGSSGTTGGCEAPLSECGDACVHLPTDPQHCGGCEQPCAANELCSAGTCALACAGGQLKCDGVCIDPLNDPKNCGDCDMQCDPNEVCGGGFCVEGCGMGQDACEQSCVDLQTDVAHCGACDMACDECQACVAGGCEDPGPPAAVPEILGDSTPCSGAEASFGVVEVPGAVSYTWTAPNGATISMGQGTASVKVQLGASDGPLCVSVSDGCASSPKKCVELVLVDGVPGQQTFATALAAQSFVVPACINSLEITAQGAQGASTDGGKGARMRGTFAVSEGETLGLVVGKRGASNGCLSGGGGGGSFVWREEDKQEPMIAAGGGGGGNGNWPGVMCRKGLDGVITIDGTPGNGPESAPGGLDGLGGLGEAPADGGAGGAGWKGDGQSSLVDSLATGGKAPFNFSGGAGDPGNGPGGEGGFGGGGGAGCGSGGGGGYSGGGAGEAFSCRAGGGGGGSFNAGTNQNNLAGARTGDGEITIVWP